MREKKKAGGCLSEVVYCKLQKALANRDRTGIEGLKAMISYVLRETRHIKKEKNVRLVFSFSSHIY